MKKHYAWVVILASVSSVEAIAQEPTQLLQSMAGTWDVQQRMWPAADAAAIDLPAAIAHRHLIDGKYLEEVMEPVRNDTTPGTSFRRNALVNYNPVAKRYEYTSLDTRAPQLMTEIGSHLDSIQQSSELKLQGGAFVAPEWGSAKNVPFKYRLTIGNIVNHTQTVQLYLTPQGVLPKKEFLAFQYVYRQPAAQ